MYDEAENLWNLFESTGCIICYLLYKQLKTNIEEM